jgi:hypothetical protein
MLHLFTIFCPLCWDFCQFSNIIASTDLWLDNHFEMIAVELKGMNPKYTRGITSMYGAPNEDVGV